LAALVDEKEVEAQSIDIDDRGTRFVKRCEPVWRKNALVMLAIDFNCDLGEGAGHDERLMPWISSANIACGAHAGDLETMRRTVALAQVAGVAIGAHPGFADREHFGRRELRLN